LTKRKDSASEFKTMETFKLDERMREAKLVSVAFEQKTSRVIRPAIEEECYSTDNPERGEGFTT